MRETCCAEVAIAATREGKAMPIIWDPKAGAAPRFAWPRLWVQAEGEGPGRVRLSLGTGGPGAWSSWIDVPDVAAAVVRLSADGVWSCVPANLRVAILGGDLTRIADLLEQALRSDAITEAVERAVTARVARCRSVAGLRRALRLVLHTLADEHRDHEHTRAVLLGLACGLQGPVSLQRPASATDWRREQRLTRRA